MFRKSCPVNRTFEKPVVIEPASLSATALAVVILSVNLINAVSLVVFVSDTAETL